MFSLKDKVAIVTGASRGIAKAIAIQLSNSGAKVVVSSRKLEEYEKVADEIRNMGGKAVVIPCHVGKKDEICRSWKRSHQHFESSGLEIIEENTGNGIWSITINLEPNFSPKQVSELVSKLSKSGHAPCEVSTLSYDLATILSAATGLTPSEVGMGVDEHFVVPLAKIGGEEE